MADGTIAVSPDSSGKKVDVSELTRVDATVVERQRIAIGDGDDAEQALAGVRGESGRASLRADADLIGVLRSIDSSLKDIRELLFATIES